MVFKLLAYILIGSGLFIPLGLAAWTFVLKPRLGPVLERHLLQRKAERRRKLLHTLATSEICIVCERPTSAEQDVFDKKTESWMHSPCYQRLLGIEERKPS